MVGVQVNGNTANGEGIEARHITVSNVVYFTVLESLSFSLKN